MPELKASHLTPWLNAVNTSRSTYYSWPDDVKPRTVLVGRHRLVVESHEAWLQRMAERQAALLKTPGRKRRAIEQLIEAQPQPEA